MTKLADAFDLIAEGYASAALALRERAAAQAVRDDAAFAGLSHAEHAAPAPPTTDTAAPIEQAAEGPASEAGESVGDPSAASFVDTPAGRSAEGGCPVHGLPWIVRPAGTTSSGRAYNAFWKCGELTDGEPCREKPSESWVEAHPPS